MLPRARVSIFATFGPQRSDRRPSKACVVPVSPLRSLKLPPIDELAPAKAAPPEAASAPAALPLVLDLDGSLIASNLLLECALAFVKRNPLHAPMLLVWLVQGRAVLKARLAEHTEINVDLLPENRALADYARQAHAEGRHVHLATAADRRIAEAVSRRYPFIREVMASGGRVNLKGRRKAEALKARFPDGFVYAGDSTADRPVWRDAAAAVYAGVDGALHRSLQKDASFEASASRAPAGLKVWARAARLHQWAKNALVFAPMLLGGRISDPHAWGACALGMLAMGLIASSTYLINDMADLEDDRRHWSKRERPLASGAIPLKSAIIVSLLGLLAGFTTALAAGGPAALGAVLVYCVGTLAYSFGLKRAPIADVVTLAGLFTMRLLLGAILAGTTLSAWLLVFSMFLFSSLCLAKRGIEIARAARAGNLGPAGRGYLGADGPLVTALGAATAAASLVVLVMYLIEDATPEGVYASPAFLWGAPIFVFLWLGRVWLLCGRGELHDDPVAFAIKDRQSLMLGALTAACFAAAIVGLPTP